VVSLVAEGWGVETGRECGKMVMKFGTNSRCDKFVVKKRIVPTSFWLIPFMNIGRVIPFFDRTINYCADSYKNWPTFSTSFGTRMFGDGRDGCGLLMGWL